MSPTWTVTHLPSQSRARPTAERSEQLKRERLANESRLLQLARKANGIPEPATWMW
tara:strand:+ start:1097 stop:1264 length:168 start_codon:yes stop_codon:yes gene_type:complete